MDSVPCRQILRNLQKKSLLHLYSQSRKFMSTIQYYQACTKVRSSHIIYSGGNNDYY